MELVTSTAFSPGTPADGVWLDQILVEPRLGLLAVADAPAGTDVGRAGVRIALDAARRHIERNADVLERFRSHPSGDLRVRILEVIDEAYGRAAQEVFAYARRNAGLLVTLDVALLLDHEVFVGHVGDGRVYLVRRGLVHQLTVDHSRGDDAPVFAGSEDDVPTAEVPREGSAVGGRTFTRALGPLPSVRVESLCMELLPDDRFVVTTAHLVRSVPEHVFHATFVGEALDGLSPALTRAAGGQPVVAAAIQLGGGEPYKADSARARLQLLAPMPLFAHCTERELRAVAAATRPRRLDTDAVLFREGDPGDELYLLISGRMRIERNGAPLAVLGPGSNFGEMAMLDERTRSAAAIAAEPCELLVIHRDAFFQLLKGNPQLAMKILWNLLLRLSANLRATNVRLASLSPAPVSAEQVVVDEAPPPRRA